MSSDKQAVLITGPTSGLGYEFSGIFAEKGYDLVLTSRDAEKLAKMKNDFEEKYKISVAVIHVDLSERNSAQQLFDECINRKIEVNILINNAAFGLFREHVALDPGTVRKMLQLNVITLTELCLLFGKVMKERGSGYILNVGSTAAFQPLPIFASYGASKSYVLNFSEALAKELEDSNVTVTCLWPGLMKTGFFTVAGVGDEAKGNYAMKARMSPRRVAEYGVSALFSRRLSVIPGMKNKLRAFVVRLFPRSLVANISKKFTANP